MKYSLSKKITLLILPALLLNLLVGAVGWHQFRGIRANLDMAELHNAALRDQMECDMMHDALRADVLAGFQAVANTNLSELRDIQADMKKHVEEFQSHLDQNEKRSLNANAAKQLNDVREPLGRYITSAGEVLALLSTNRQEAASRLPVFYDAFKVLEGKMQSVSDAIEEETKSANNRIDASMAAFTTFLTVSVVIAALLLFGLPMLVLRIIPTPFRAVAAALLDVSTHTRQGVEDARAAGRTLAEGAGSQASSLEETSSALEEIASMVKRNAASAKGAETMARDTKQAADSGGKEVRLMSEVVKRVSSSCQELKGTMGEIRLASDGVAKIVKTIDEIAFQTNILALNAAVEAARAGESGLGFAVVAEEVRNLAQRSANSAKETAQKIATAIDRSNAGVQVSERLIKVMQDLEGQASSVERSLEAILEKSRQTDSFVQGICQASQEQSLGVDQVTRSVSTIDQITQRNAATAEEGAKNSEALQEQCVALVQTVDTLLDLVEGSQRPRAAHPATAAVAFVPDPRSQPIGALSRHGWTDAAKHQHASNTPTSSEAVRTF